MGLSITDVGLSISELGLQIQIWAHIHILSRPGRYLGGYGRYLGGNLARTRKFLASERKFFGQQLTVAASKSSSTTLGIKSKVFLKMKIL